MVEEERERFICRPLAAIRKFHFAEWIAEFGAFVATYPKWWLVLSLLMTLFLGSYLAQLKMISDPEELFVPSGSLGLEV